MKQNLYIFSDTLIRRKNSTIWCEKIIKENTEYEDELDIRKEYLLGEDTLIPAGEKRCIPVENIESVMAFGTLHFNSRFLYFLSQNQIPMHIFSTYGNYGGSFIPSEIINSGTILLKQAAHHKHPLKRLYIAKQIITAAMCNAIANLNYHLKRGANLKEQIEQINELKEYLSNAESVEELMGLEGAAKKAYYNGWRCLFTYPVDFTIRIKRPPNNLINALISYGNAIVYSVCLNEIYHTRLYPEIGFVHQPGEGKMSLAYDLADIFKPLITDRVIFKMINKNIISENDAIIKNGRCLLKKKAKQQFAAEIDNKLMAKIQLPKKQTRYSYRRIIREECYKLISHFNEEDKYKPFITRW